MYELLRPDKFDYLVYDYLIYGVAPLLLCKYSD